MDRCMDGWISKELVLKWLDWGKYNWMDWGKYNFFFQQILSILLNSFDLILTLKILECVEGNFHAPIQSNAIYNE